MVDHTCKLYWQISSHYDQQYNAKMATIWKKEKLIIIYMYVQLWQPKPIQEYDIRLFNHNPIVLFF
jgi:hypothetical protein